MRLFSAKVKHLAASMAMVGLVLIMSSTPALAACKGDNGDIKVHNKTTAQTDQRDEPKVCEFYLDAFNFDNAQSVSWKISENTHGATALSGSITLDQNGHGVTSTYKLDNGMYKVYWNFTGEHGSAKHKVFKVDCETTPCPAPAPQPTPTPCPKPQPTPCPKPVVTPPTTTPPTTTPVVGRGGQVLAAETTQPVAATLPNTGVSTLTTSVLAGVLMVAASAIAFVRPRKQLQSVTSVFKKKRLKRGAF